MAGPRPSSAGAEVGAAAPRGNLQTPGVVCPAPYAARVPLVLRVLQLADDVVFGFEGEELALVITNDDGSVISPTGIVGILSKGDSCLMGWQMKRKNEPVGGGEAGVREEVKLSGAVGSRTIVGGVALDLPF